MTVFQLSRCIQTTARYSEWQSICKLSLYSLCLLGCTAIHLCHCCFFSVSVPHWLLVCIRAHEHSIQHGSNSTIRISWASSQAVYHVHLNLGPIDFSQHCSLLVKLRYRWWCHGESSEICFGWECSHVILVLQQVSEFCFIYAEYFSIWKIDESPWRTI